jgi:hypothetical protein
LSLLESLAKAKTSKSSSALQSMRKQFFDTNVVAHQDYPCQMAWPANSNNHPKIHFAFGVRLWTWSTTMLIEITRNSNIFLTLGLKNLKIHLHEISLVKGFFNITKELAQIFLLKMI